MSIIIEFAGVDVIWCLGLVIDIRWQGGTRLEGLIILNYLTYRLDNMLKEHMIQILLASLYQYSLKFMNIPSLISQINSTFMMLNCQTVN